MIQFLIVKKELFRGNLLVAISKHSEYEFAKQSIKRWRTDCPGIVYSIVEVGDNIALD